MSRLYRVEFYSVIHSYSLEIYQDFLIFDARDCGIQMFNVLD